MKIRAFIALDIPEKSVSEIIDIRDRIVVPDANIRWEPKEKLHLTLKFLGDIDQSNIGKYCGALESIINGHPAIDLSFSGFGVFKRDDVLKILWLGLTENDTLTRFAGKIDELFAGFGFPPEKRKFKSHITLLRFRGYEDSKKILSLTGVNLPEIKFKSDTVTLYESRLLEGGSVYRSLKKFKLKN